MIWPIAVVLCVTEVILVGLFITAVSRNNAHCESSPLKMSRAVANCDDLQLLTPLAFSSIASHYSLFSPRKPAFT